MRKIGLALLFTLTCFLTFNVQAQDTIFIEKETNRWVDSLMNKLTLEEKIGQLFMVAAYSNKDQQHIDEINYIIKKYNVGGLIFFQGGPGRQATLTNQYQSISQIPLLIAMDGEWGLGMRLDSTISYPRQMLLGAVQNDSIIYQMGYDIGKQMQRLGVHINFAPVVDVNNNPLNPVINVRSFGENPELVAQKGIMYMQGMQDAGIIATAKHFPGHGDTDKDSHHTLPSVNYSRERLDSIELYPFKKIFDAGIKGVMIAHLNVPSLGTEEDTPTTLSRKVVTDLLKEELGFNGLIFTDALNMKGATDHYKAGEIESMALQAGNDVLLFPVSVSKAVSKIKRAIRRGNLTEESIEKSCRKVLMAKYELGLHKTTEFESFVKTEDLSDDLNKLVYKLTHRDLIEDGLTVIKNDQNILPVKSLRRKKFASLAFNTDQITEFQKKLGKYASVDHFVYNENKKDSLFEMLKNYDVVFTSYHNTSYWPSGNYKVSLKELNSMAELAKHTKLVFSLFANPYSLRNFKNMGQFQAILIGYSDESEVQSVAAQAIFGGIQVSGHLPVGINENYPEGTGIELKKKIRLGYGIPEQVGISSKKLQKIDSIAQMAIDSMATPGCRILVARDGKVFYDKSFG